MNHDTIEARIRLGDPAFQHVHARVLSTGLGAVHFFAGGGVRELRRSLCNRVSRSDTSAALGISIDRFKGVFCRLCTSKLGAQ